jgi:endoglucanase Acf2
MPKLWNNNLIGTLQDGLFNRGFKVRRYESDGCVCIEAQHTLGKLVAYRFKIQGNNRFALVS